MRQTKDKTSYGAKRGVALVLAALILFVSMGIFPASVFAAKSNKKGKLLTLAAAKSIAVANSEKIENLEIQIDSKQAAMQSAIRSLREKERTMNTFSWTPLLSFKFPTKPTEAEAFEFQFKPKQLQYQMKILKHKVKDETYQINEKVSNIYVDIIAAQDLIEFNEKRAKKLNSSLEKLKAKQLLGEASQDQVDTAEKRVENIEKKITSARTKLERAESKLSDLVGFDVSVNYRFQDAYVTAELSRKNLEALQKSAVDGDQTVFEARMEEEQALLALQINYNLVRNKYGGYVGMIDPYIQQALSGAKVSKKPFKKAYDKFLKDIDAKWQGSYRILFIKFPKEWIKGKLDGIRYVQDEPYCLYTAALDYESALKERKAAEKELKDAVADTYDNYASTKKAYKSTNESYKKAQALLLQDEVRYLLGNLTEDEFSTEESEEESLESDTQDALKTYSETLYSFDRTTCGGVSRFFHGMTDEAVNLSPVLQTGLTYTLRPIVSSSEFLLSVNKPADYTQTTGISVTDFELWSDGKQIGSRTPIGRTLRHLALTVSDVNEVFIRLYDGTTFVDDCEIDPLVYSGPLTISGGLSEEGDAHVLGTYTASDSLATDTFSVSIEFDQDKVQQEYVSGQEAAYYNIATESGKFLLSDEMIKEDESFTYLSFVKNDIESLVIHLYDKEGGQIGVAYFNDSTKEVYHKVDAAEAAAIAEEKEKQAKKKEEEQKKQEEEDKEKERREQAEEVLKRLGMPVNKSNLAYAMAHYNELNYAADQNDNINTLNKNIAATQKAIKEANAAGIDASDLQKRLDILNGSKQTYQKTLNQSAVYQQAKKKK